MLHALAALILITGTWWWWRAAPHQAADDRLTGWGHTAEQLLPDIGDHEMANTLALESGVSHEEIVEVNRGDFLVSVVCAGGDGSRVRVSLGSPGDSGRGLRCSGSRTPDVFSVGLMSELRLLIAVETAGPVVFRYAVQRSNG